VSRLLEKANQNVCVISLFNSEYAVFAHTAEGNLENVCNMKLDTSHGAVQDICTWLRRRTGGWKKITLWEA
jgi:hypothetical protein